VNGVLSCVGDLAIFYWFNQRYKMKKRKEVRIVLSFLIILGVLLTENYFNINNLSLLVWINFGFYTLTFYLVYEEKSKVVWLRGISMLVGVMISEILITLVTMLLTAQYELEIVLEATHIRWWVLYISAKGCECVVLNIINKITEYTDKKEVRKIVVWNVVFLGAVLGCFYLYLRNIISSNGDIYTEQVFWVQLVILGVILFAYLNIMNNYYYMNNKKIELENFLNALKREAKYYEQTNALHEEIRKIKHDMKNFLILAENSDKRYLKDIDEYFDKFNNYVNSGNRILDLLIMNKAKICQEKNIEFKYQLSTQNLGNLNALDIISIFGNILDNAIEACEKNEKREIYFKIWEANGFVFIKEENPMAEILMKQSKFITTKHDRDLHGLGLTCVEEAIKHYDGICKFFIQDGKFHVTLSIPIGNMSN
jgi:hypothetical protein